MYNINKDSHPRDVICKSHNARNDRHVRDVYRTCPSKLTRKELEDLYFSLLENNMEMKQTINSQQDKIKVLSTKLQRSIAVNKHVAGKDKDCCRSKSLLDEQKDSVVELKKSNERLAERIRVLNMRLCSAKQFAKKSQSSVNRNTFRNSSLSALNNKQSDTHRPQTPVSQYEKEVMSTFRSTRSVETETQPTDEAVDKASETVNQNGCNENKCRTVMEELKQKILDLQQELSSCHEEYSARITRLECELTALDADRQRQRANTDHQILQHQQNENKLKNKLREVECQCGDLNMQLAVERSKVSELEAQLKMTDMSTQVVRSIDNLAAVNESKRDSYSHSQTRYSESPVVPSPNRDKEDSKLHTSNDSGYMEVEKQCIQLESMDTSNEGIDAHMLKVNQELLKKISDLQKQLDLLVIANASKTDQVEKSIESMANVPSCGVDTDHRNKDVEASQERDKIYDNNETENRNIVGDESQNNKIQANISHTRLEPGFIEENSSLKSQEADNQSVPQTHQNQGKLMSQDDMKFQIPGPIPPLDRSSTPKRKRRHNKRTSEEKSVKIHENKTMKIPEKSTNIACCSKSIRKTDATDATDNKRIKSLKGSSDVKECCSRNIKEADQTDVLDISDTIDVTQNIKTDVRDTTNTINVKETDTTGVLDSTDTNNLKETAKTDDLDTKDMINVKDTGETDVLDISGTTDVICQTDDLNVNKALAGCFLIQNKSECTRRREKEMVVKGSDQSTQYENINDVALCSSSVCVCPCERVTSRRRDVSVFRTGSGTLRFTTTPAGHRFNACACHGQRTDAEQNTDLSGNKNKVEDRRNTKTNDQQKQRDSIKQNQDDKTISKGFEENTEMLSLMKRKSLADDKSMKYDDTQQKYCLEDQESDMLQLSRKSSCDKDKIGSCDKDKISSCAKNESACDKNKSTSYDKRENACDKKKTNSWDKIKNCDKISSYNKNKTTTCDKSENITCNKNEHKSCDKDITNPCIKETNSCDKLQYTYRKNSKDSVKKTTGNKSPPTYCKQTYCDPLLNKKDSLKENTYNIAKYERSTSPDNTEREISSLTDLPDERAKSPPLSPGEEKATLTQTDDTLSQTDYGSLSEGELPVLDNKRNKAETSKEKRTSMRKRSDADEIFPKSSSQRMELALQSISEELAKCRQLLDRRRSPECASDALRLRPVPAAARLAAARRAHFTLHIGTIVLSDEAVMNSRDKSLVLKWKFYDQNVTMTRVPAGRVLLFDFSAEYNIPFSEEFIDYMKKEEMPLIISELDNEDRPFATSHLPLRDILLKMNTRVDMSLALMCSGGGAEVGVLDLWGRLRGPRAHTLSILAQSPQNIHTPEDGISLDRASQNIGLDVKATDKRKESRDIRQTSFRRSIVKYNPMPESPRVNSNQNDMNLESKGDNMQQRTSLIPKRNGLKRDSSTLITHAIPSNIRSTDEMKAALENQVNNNIRNNKIDDVEKGLPDSLQNLIIRSPQGTVKAIKTVKYSDATVDTMQQVGSIEEQIPQCVDITVLWLALNEECEAMVNPNIKRLYVSYNFLGRSGAEFETPISLPKPKNYADKCYFNFRKKIYLQDHDIPALGHMCHQRAASRSTDPRDCIVFTVVSEPPEDPLGLATCEDIGYGYVYLGDILSYCGGGSSYTEVVAVRAARGSGVCGVLALRLRNLQLLRSLRDKHMDIAQL